MSLEYLVGTYVTYISADSYSANICGRGRNPGYDYLDSSEKFMGGLQVEWR